MILMTPTYKWESFFVLLVVWILVDMRRFHASEELNLLFYNCNLVTRRIGTTGMYSYTMCVL
jgi:hypothetical protein